MSEATLEESDVTETYLAMRAIAIDALNAGTRALALLDGLAPIVRKTVLSDYIPLQPGEKITVAIEYKRLHVPNFLAAALAQLKDLCASRSCAVGFEIVQLHTDNVVCTLDTTKPLF